MAFQIVTKKRKELEDRLWTFKQQNKHCDAELIINEHKIPVHSVVLASCSEYFDLCFSNTSSPNKVVTIFEDVDVMSFFLIIEYCYSGKIKITEANAKHLAKIANFLIMPTIIDGACKTLKMKLNISNCLELWMFAKTEHLLTLSDVSLKFARENFEQIYSSKEFLELEDSDLNELLSGHVIVTSEKVIYDSIKNWIKHDEPSRKHHFVTLLDRVKLSCLPQDILLTEPRSLCSSTDCFNKFFDALESQKKTGFSECTQTTLVALDSNESDISNIMEIFDLTTEKWIDVNIDCNRPQSTSVLFDDKLISIGGSVNGLAANTATCYDLKSSLTENYPSMRYPRIYPSVIKYEGFVFVIGGFNGENATPNVERFDPNKKTWSVSSPMSASRYLCGVAVLNQEIYVVGGYSEEDRLSSTEAYSVVTNKWRSRASLNSVRSEHGMVGHKGYLYVMGGLDGGSSLSSAERYDPVIDKWTIIESIDPPKHAFASTIYMGKITLAGGEIFNGKKSRFLSSVLTYDDNDQNWTTMVSLNRSRKFFQLIEIPLNLALKIISRNA